jgi:type VI secretion system protein ImpA
LADQAARWGSMPLHEWLRNVVHDEATLSHVEALLGVGQCLPKADDT